jgi:hypothetical protein
MTWSLVHEEGGRTSCSDVLDAITWDDEQDVEHHNECQSPMYHTIELELVTSNPKLESVASNLESELVTSDLELEPTNLESEPAAGESASSDEEPVGITITPSHSKKFVPTAPGTKQSQIPKCLFPEDLLAPPPAACRLAKQRNKKISE